MLEQQSILALLQTFEVTARHLSFTLAAHEMNLTQGAVSHRIRRLEMHIGFRLFIRMTRKLALTEEGKRLLATLSHSLRAINDELRIFAIRICAARCILVLRRRWPICG